MMQLINIPQMYNLSNAAKVYFKVDNWNQNESFAVYEW